MGEKDYLEYQLACTEVLEMIKNMPKKDAEKIPSSVIKNMQNSKRYDYKFRYNTKKKFDEQNISKRAKEMLNEIYRDYIVSNSIKKIMISKEKFDKKKSKK